MRTMAEVGRRLARRRSTTRWSLFAGATVATALLVSGAPLARPGAGAEAVHALSLPSTTVPASPTTTVPPAPTTTVPHTPTAPSPQPVPAPTAHAATPATPAAPASVKRGILPPQEPPSNIPPSPNFLQDCQGSQYDDSPGCVNATLSAIDNARAAEGLPGMTLPGNWTQLTEEQQLFVVTDLERTVRGLAPLSAMADALDQAAAQGASQSTDPSPPAGFPYTQWGSNWAGAVGNPLEAMYYWMYDDGLGSSNIDCTASNQSGCWGHRDNVLLALTCQMCVMGTGVDPTGWNGDPSLAELLVDSSGQPSVVFTWQQEQAYF